MDPFCGDPRYVAEKTSGEAGTRPKSEEAYDLYLRSIAVPRDVAPNKGAIAMLERAVAIDPSYAPAWEALGLRYYPVAAAHTIPCPCPLGSPVQRRRVPVSCATRGCSRRH
jgi:hypothetical protein